MNIHPQIIEKDGKKEFAVLPYHEFIALEEALQDYEDLQDLREAKLESQGQESIPLNRVMADLGL